MDSTGKRNLFLLVIGVLVALLVIVAAVILLRGPRDSSVELVARTDSGELRVNDLYEGEMVIPYYDIPTNSYKADQFTEDNGAIAYKGGACYVGINVNSKTGAIDWAKVAESGVDYAMIRVGYRGNDTGKLCLDPNFEENVQGARDAGLPFGFYFYSKAVTDAEADEEATFVLEKIRDYQLTYPVAYYWEYTTNDDGSKNADSRTIRCNGQQVTGFIGTFCKKIKAAGYNASFYCDKSMGYDSLDLSALKDYDMWYAEYRAVPSFYYDFKMWQYTKSGSVPGIDGDVAVNLALKKYDK